MFSESRNPRVYALAPGVDFPAALVAGLRQRLTDTPPEAMARVTLIVNTDRMRRRVAALLAEGSAGFLPRIRLVTDLGRDIGCADIPAAIPGLRRRLQLTQAIDRLMTADPSIAPRTSLFDLADSLATLMDEMQGEGVDPSAIAALDVSGHSAHWRRTQQFLGIMARFFAADAMPDVEARQRMVVQQLASQWALHPPSGPVILAGSTGSRGTTALLMQAIARLPQGAIVLPGFDDEQPEDVWKALQVSGTAEDHPQFRFHNLLHALGMSAKQVESWHLASVAPNKERNRLVSLALRPAPVTDQWMRDGKLLTGLPEATDGLTLIEAPSPRIEALAISLVLREAAEKGQKVALITPDRGLSRMVAASLDRWGIIPDDSAGRPLALSPPGRFLRHVAGLAGYQLTSEVLLALLKHPLTSSGGGRGDHLRWTRLLERHIREKALPFATVGVLHGWAAKQTDSGVGPWTAWLCDALENNGAIGPRALNEHVVWHMALAELLAQGPVGTGSGELWSAVAGSGARQVMQTLSDEAEHAGMLSPKDYDTLFNAVLQQAEPIRDTVLAHPDVMIWGTLEARVQGADLVILGGLNEGVWPGSPTPDPWLNRKMRQDAGLLLPDRQIGLAAHDFQQAIGVQTVVLTRAKRNAEAETVASRWLNRLTNLMEGLVEQDGAKHLAAMRARGKNWLALTDLLDASDQIDAPSATRPSPRPPLGVRPTELPVTDMAKLIRDPYSIYAKRILRLRPINPLRPKADRLLKGQVLHSALEAYARLGLEADNPGRRERLLTILQSVLDADVAWPAARALWFAKLERASGYFLEQEAARNGRPVLLEEQGRLTLDDLGFTLTARPDRIDLLPDGRSFIIDYKSGKPPTPAMQKDFDKQLLFAAVMGARGAFGGNVPSDIAEVAFIGFGATPETQSTEITSEILDEHWQGLCKLIRHYQRASSGYTARRALFLTKDHSDYDHLSRFGEWDTGDPPVAENVGDAE